MFAAEIRKKRSAALRALFAEASSVTPILHLLRQGQCLLWVTSGPSAAPPRRSVPGGRTDEIRAKAEVTARKSVVGGRADLPRAWLELRFLARNRPSALPADIEDRKTTCQLAPKFLRAPNVLSSLPVVREFPEVFRSMPVASMPMYDMPEVQGALNSLRAGLVRHLKREGLIPTARISDSQGIPFLG